MRLVRAFPSFWIRCSDDVRSRPCRGFYFGDENKPDDFSAIVGRGIGASCNPVYPTLVGATEVVDRYMEAVAVLWSILRVRDRHARILGNICLLAKPLFTSAP
jgi:hypothetical protein